MQYLDAIHLSFMGVQVEGEAVGDIEERWNTSTKPKRWDHLVTVIWN